MLTIGAKATDAQGFQGDFDMSMKKLAGGVALSVLTMAMASAVYAQETSSAISGQVTGADGKPAAGATVSITHVPTGTTATTVTSSTGFYIARGLRVGGPYTVKVTSGGASETTNVQSIGIGNPVPVDVSFAQTEVAEVVVTAAIANRENNGGPTSRYGLGDIQELPSLKRDLKDVARLNPMVTLDPSNLDAMIVAGTNSRYNSFTVDGVKQNDDFGLNANGYPTQRGPISTDAVQAMAVNLAPYSVLYNDFQGANVNVVTKSGTNTFHGSFTDEYSSTDYIGETVRGAKIANQFEEKTWAATLGGPIIKDKLFFFLSYEKFEAERATVAGPVGSGKPVITGSATAAIPYVTAAQITAIQDILASVYSFDYDKTHSILGNVLLPENDEKKLAKIDWNITDDHRFAFTYQRTAGTRQIEGNRSSLTQLALGSDYYTKGDDLEVFSGQLNSTWGEHLKTELTATQKTVVTLQLPVSGAAGNSTVAGDEPAEFGQFSIAGNPAVSGTGTRILAGPDNSRQANELNNKLTSYRGRVFYDLGDNSFSAGIEREKLAVYNLFIQRSEGEFTFNTVANLQAQLPDQVRYQNAIVDANGDGFRNEVDAAAKFSYTTDSLYAQDVLRITPDLSITAGARYVRLGQSDKPLANQYFLNRYGFSNSENLDGRNTMLPRVSFDWRPSFDQWHVSRVRVTGGAGLFSGGAATVWVSNSFSNTGVLAADISCFRNQTNTNCGLAAGTTDNAVLATLTNYKDISAAFEALLDPTKPTIVNIQKAASANGIEPGFKPISTWKTSLSVSADLDLGYLGSGYNFTLDFLRGDVNNAIIWQDYRAGLTPQGYAPDGRPIYRNAAQRGLFVSGAVSNDTGSDYILTNTKEGWQQTIAVSLSKGFDYGFDGSLSYAFNRAKDVNPGISSVAATNYAGPATADSQHPGLATSSFEIKNSFKGRLSWTHMFFGDNKTNVTLFGELRSGLPFSYVYNTSATTGIGLWGDAGAAGATSQGRQLVYVPKTDSSGNVTLTSYPIVTYTTTGATAVDIAALNDYLHSTGLIKYAGQISPRNGFKGDDVSRIDLHLSQELPAFFPGGAKLLAYMDIVNLGNLLNDKWGVVEQFDFPQTATILTPTIVNGKYNYASFVKGIPTFGSSDAPNRSLWQLKFGLKYSF